jgi:toxin-antitoxin system PIN domain toxin
VIVPDVNLLLYAYDVESANHEKAAGWWTGCLSGTEAVGLAPAVLFGFVRVATSARVFKDPLTAIEAARHVTSWLNQPAAQVLGTDGAHVTQALGLLIDAGTAGNFVTDAQIAALALDHDAVVHTADTDFLRFPGLRWFNPLTGASGRNRSPSADR